MKMYEQIKQAVPVQEAAKRHKLPDRLLNISNSDVAQQIAKAFQLTIHEDDEPFDREPNLKVFMNHELLCERTLISYWWLLEEWKDICEPTDPNQPVDDRYAEACRMLPTVNFLLDCFSVGNFEQRQALIKELLKKETISKLRDYASKEWKKIGGRFKTL